MWLFRSPEKPVTAVFDRMRILNYSLEASGSRIPAYRERIARAIAAGIMRV